MHRTVGTGAIAFLWGPTLNLSRGVSPCCCVTALIIAILLLTYFFDQVKKGGIQTTLYAWTSDKAQRVASAFQDVTSSFAVFSNSTRDAVTVISQEIVGDSVPSVDIFRTTPKERQNIHCDPIQPQPFEKSSLSRGSNEKISSDGTVLTASLPQTNVAGNETILRYFQAMQVQQERERLKQQEIDEQNKQEREMLMQHFFDGRLPQHADDGSMLQEGTGNQYSGSSTGCEDTKTSAVMLPCLSRSKTSEESPPWTSFAREISSACGAVGGRNDGSNGFVTCVTPKGLQAVDQSDTVRYFTTMENADATSLQQGRLPIEECGLCPAASCVDDPATKTESLRQPTNARKRKSRPLIAKPPANKKSHLETRLEGEAKVFAHAETVRQAAEAFTCAQDTPKPFTKPSTHCVNCHVCKKSVEIAEHLALPFVRPIKSARDKASREAIREHCKRTHGHEMIWEVASLHDFVSKRVFCSSPEKLGATLVLVHTFLSDGFLPAFTCPEQSSGSERLLLALDIWMTSLQEQGMDKLSCILTRFQTDGLYKPMSEKKETDRKQKWVAKATKVVSGILQDARCVGRRDFLRRAQLEEWCRKGVKQLPEEYHEPIKALLSQRLWTIVESTH